MPSSRLVTVPLTYTAGDGMTGSSIVGRPSSARDSRHADPCCEVTPQASPTPPSVPGVTLRGGVTGTDWRGPRGPDGKASLGRRVYCFWRGVEWGRLQKRGSEHKKATLITSR